MQRDLPHQTSEEIKVRLSLDERQQLAERYAPTHLLIRHLPEFIRRHFPEPKPDAKEELTKIVHGDADIALASVLDLVGIGRDRTAAQRAWEHYFDIINSDDYDVQLLPNLDPRRRRFTEEDIETLSWLIYPGLWGDRPLFSIGGSGPKGPLWQGLKSDNPFEWVRRVCVADDMYSP